VKEQDIPALENETAKLLPESYLYTAEPDVKEDIPVALENKKIIEPFEVVTDLYGRPVYRNIDPTGPLSLFFALSFAFCVSDAAYGLIMIVLSLIFMKKFKFMPVIVKFLRLILYSGIATMIIGALTGGWFGDLLNRMPDNSHALKMLGKMVILNPLESGNNAFIFLGWALILGYIQILWGLSLNLFNSVRQYGIKKSGEPFILLAIQTLAALLILFFIALRKGILPGGSIKITAVLLAACFIYLMALKARDQQGLLMKLFWAVYGGYNVIAGNLLGDVLSYSRLFGLGLTSAVLGFVVNEIVFMSTGIPFIGYLLALLIFIAGHSANLVLSLFGSYVHTSRLQYLEFFTKFFESGGRPFSPLRETRHYTFIEKS
jgi:V/A-type H+-transporting ATPase subunit I